MIDRLNVNGNGSINFVTKDELLNVCESCVNEKLIYTDITDGNSIKYIKAWGIEYTGFGLKDIFAKAQVCLQTNKKDDAIVAFNIDTEIKGDEVGFIKHVLEVVRSYGASVYISTLDNNKNKLV